MANVDNELPESRNPTQSVPRSRPSHTSTYDPNAFCDYCKRAGHTNLPLVIAFNGYPRSDLDHNRGMSSGNHGGTQGYGRGNSQVDQTDYQRGMNVLHEQYNQILTMLDALMYMRQSGPSTSHSSQSSANLARNIPQQYNYFALTSHYTDRIIDSGATNHMTPHADMLVHKHTLSPNNPRTVQLPNGTTTHITHTGSIPAIAFVYSYTIDHDPSYARCLLHRVSSVVHVHSASSP
ncbi:hypothetical protein H5410_054670 [Solanum commersonii]|uniref:Retrovirus-related Pol polyprotein from transposon TNT 1-94-like beta-barrel domain-containing protein n=1 Tax=Solanum commersonii TaxID=4109 RepID=A0A9J5WHU3_SOLCO|nr:hypothetical protein H5410_054670 [Solanum commersonii]